MSKFARAFAAAHTITNLTGDEAAILRGVMLAVGSDAIKRANTAQLGLARKGLIHSELLRPTPAGLDVLNAGELILECRGEALARREVAA